MDSTALWCPGEACRGYRGSAAYTGSFDGQPEMTSATRLTVVLLLLIAGAHLLRLIVGVEITVGGRTVPMWVSAVAAVVPAALAIALWRERRH